ncbi:MAG: branched-chain amino acid ABC transporter permease [Candidatus Bathyarchaeia archaeon]|nr:branched-chain amino acid ABC transporter permease [Candidatus Bathyarchaeota archaeon]
MLDLWVSNIFNGFILGIIYATMAMGMSLIFGVMGIKNLAHGDFTVIGMYTSFWLFLLFNIPPLVSIPISFALFFVIGMIITRFIFKYIIGEMLGSIILTFGLSIFIENVMLFVWGADYRMIPVSFGVYKIGLISIDGKYLIALGLTLTLIVLVQLFLTRTKIGTAIRAVSQDPDAAESLGISSERIRLIGGGIGLALAGAGGAILSLIYYIYPYLGVLLTLYSLIICVFAGLGNVAGTIFTGIIIGIAQSIFTIYVTFSLAPIVGFIIFILVLLFRPQGLFGMR